MAIAFLSAVRSASTSFTSTPPSVALDTTGSSNVAILVYAYVFYPGTDTCNGITYNSVSLTAGTSFTFGYPVFAQLFWGVFASGVSANLVATFSSAGSQPVFHAVAYSGVASIANENHATGTNTSPSVVITTVSGNKAVVAGVYDYTAAGATSTAGGSGATAEFDDKIPSGGTPGWNGYFYDKTASGASTTVDWSLNTAGGKWGIAGVSLTPFATAKLFRNSSDGRLSGLGNSGPLFQNPLQ